MDKYLYVIVLVHLDDWGAKELTYLYLYILMTGRWKEGTQLYSYILMTGAIYRSS